MTKEPHEMRWEYVNPKTGRTVTKGTILPMMINPECSEFIPAEWTAMDGTVWRFNGRARYDE